MSTVAYRLPPDARERMRAPFGEVLSEQEFQSAVGAGTYTAPFIAVGDVVADTLIRLDIPFRTIVYDLITKRDAIGAGIKARLSGHPAREVVVESEAATISQALYDAVAAAVVDPEPTRIRVIGEEDLATLPALAHAPSGATVLYGMPSRGLVPVPVDDESRKRALDWLTLMKVGPE